MAYDLLDLFHNIYCVSFVLWHTALDLTDDFWAVDFIEKVFSFVHRPKCSKMIPFFQLWSHSRAKNRHNFRRKKRAWTAKFWMDMPFLTILARGHKNCWGALRLATRFLICFRRGEEFCVPCTVVSLVSTEEVAFTIFTEKKPDILTSSVITSINSETSHSIKFHRQSTVLQQYRYTKNI